MKNLIIKYKKEIIIFSLFLGILIWCSLNTFVSSDDITYSFFYRSSERITNIVQIIRSQASDYLTVNSRIILHAIVQFLLIFDKNLWAILNPFVILISIIYIVKIVKLYVKVDNYIIYLYSIILFLLLGSYKFIIYWVAGSVNYVWAFLILIIFIYYYLKNGLLKHWIINIVFLLILPCVHESLMVFSIIFIVFDIILQYYKNKSIDKKYIYFIIAVILGSAFTLLSPGNLSRMSAASWQNLSLLSKLNMSIPKVSYNLLCLFSIDNILPWIFIISLVISLMHHKFKGNYMMISMILLNVLVIILTKISWLYFTLAIILFISENWIWFKQKRYELVVLSLGFYGIVFSMIITPEFSAGRPNYHMYMYMIIVSGINFFQIIKQKHFKFILPILSCLFAVLLVREIEIYKNIGSVHKERLTNIEIAKKENLKVVKYKLIDEKYADYHMDSNGLEDNKHWAYKDFLHYYHLDDDTIIETYR